MTQAQPFMRQVEYGIGRLRVDCQLTEALTRGVDPCRRALGFGIDEKTAIRCARRLQDRAVLWRTGKIPAVDVVTAACDALVVSVSGTSCPWLNDSPTWTTSTTSSNTVTEHRRRSHHGPP